MVYYRKYRSQTIDQLDSERVRESLRAALSQIDSPHAYLFTGPKGLGKTSTARIVAKVLNCERATDNLQLTSNKKNKSEVSGQKLEARNIEPCNTCTQCLSITAGTNLDVIEIDAASNRGIDEMRDLKEKIRLAPIKAHKKVYIIDEVHMLTTEAFNALLKTLEEPPEHAVLILCTTEAHKLPSTILSRCFTIQFSRATEKELIRAFKRIVESEKLDIDESALSSIAHMADGGFRDGVKILEELVGLAGDKKITKELVEEKYHVVSSSYYVGEFLDLLQKHDTKKSLILIDKIVSQGIDTKYFITELLTNLHFLLLDKVGVPQDKKPQVQFSLDKIKKLIDLSQTAYNEIKYAVVPQLPLELLVVEWNTLKGEGESIRQAQDETGKGKETREDIDDSKSEEKGNLEVGLVENGVTVGTLRKKVGDIQKVQLLYGEKPKEENETKKEPLKGISILHFSAEGEITKEWLSEFWKCMISEMKNHNHTIAGVLRGCVLKNFDRKKLTIETAYKFHKDKLDEVKILDTLTQIATSLTGNPVEVKVELKGKEVI